MYTTDETCTECEGTLYIDENSYTPLKEQPSFTINELFCNTCGLIHNTDMNLDIEVEKLLYRHLIREGGEYSKGKQFITNFCKVCGSRNLKFAGTYIRNDGVAYSTKCLICGHCGVVNVSDKAFSFNGLKDKITEFCKPHHGKTFPEIKTLVEEKFKTKIAMSSLKNWGVVGSCTVPSRNIKENPNCPWCGGITEKNFPKGDKLKRWKCKSKKCKRSFNPQTRTECKMCKGFLGKPIRIGICMRCQIKLKKRFCMNGRKPGQIIISMNKYISKFGISPMCPDSIMKIRRLPIL